MKPTLLPYGDRAWLVDGVADPPSLAETLAARVPSGAEIVAGARTCLVRTTAPLARGALEEALARVSVDPSPAGAEREPVLLRVRYDGEDLASAAEQLGLSRAELIEAHAGVTYRVAFLGFAPGFAYLSGLPARLNLPRRSTPRVRVPAGSLAIADQYSAVYPRASPGGWHLLGSCDEWLFDVGRQPPARLTPGAPVRFEPT